jgi:hypothetical protein
MQIMHIIDIIFLHLILHILCILHISHIVLIECISLHIAYTGILFCIFRVSFLYWLYFTYFAYIVYESHPSVFRCLFSLLLGPPSSCSRTTTYIHPHCSCFYHGELQESLLILFACQGNRPFLTHWNNRKASQYGGDWNDIQDLCLFTAIVDD